MRSREHVRGNTFAGTRSREHDVRGNTGLLRLGQLGSHSVTTLVSKSQLKLDQKINKVLDRFFIGFQLIFSIEIDLILIKNQDHRRIKAKRPRAAKCHKYKYKRIVFWVSGFDFLTNFG